MPLINATINASEFRHTLQTRVSTPVHRNLVVRKRRARINSGGVESNAGNILLGESKGINI